MNPSLLALASAVAYGLADFAGGFTAKSRSAWAVVGWTQLVGVVVLAGGLVVVPATSVGAADLAFGAFAGVAGMLGLNLLYRALASGVMSVVAPVSAAAGGVFSVCVGLLRGEALNPLQVVGITLAMAAIAAVTWQGPGRQVDRRPVWMALGAGVFFGSFFVAMSFTSEAAGLWPLVPARAASIGISLVLAGSDRWPPVAGYLRWVVSAGVLDMLANLFIVLAAQRGPLSIMAVLGSLYPVFTVVAAVLYLKERPRPIQAVGLVLAVGAVLLLA